MPRLRITLAAIVAYLLFAGLGSLFGIPDRHQIQGSLFWPGGVLGAIGSLILIGVTLEFSLILGTLITARFRRNRSPSTPAEGQPYFEAGFFAACMGLAALSIRTGDMGNVLRTQGAGAWVFTVLALELLLLGGLVIAVWMVLRMLKAQGWVDVDLMDAHGPGAGGAAAPQEDWAQRLTATAAHALLVFTAMSLIARSDAKAQVLGAVFISSLLGSTGAYMLFPVRQSVWYWVSPLLVGVIGYLIAWFDPTGWTTGRLSGSLAFLARPLPLDYASAGPAGAMLGLWIAQGWHASQAAENTESDASPHPSNG